MMQLARSPLEVGDEVEVIGMASEDDCHGDVPVMLPWKKRTLAVPPSQLEPLGGDPQTEEAVADWRYWVRRGYDS